jgi:hypothetical protein
VWDYDNRGLPIFHHLRPWKSSTNRPRGSLTRPFQSSRTTPTPLPLLPPADLSDRRVISLFPPHADGPAFGLSKGGGGGFLAGY